MAQNAMALAAWKAMAFIRKSSQTTSLPEIRAALIIAEAGMLALLREIARQEAALRKLA